MQGQPERAMRAGVMVTFRLEGALELLWKARMSSVPQDNNVCVQISNGVETSYKVERVMFEFLHSDVAEVIGYDENGMPQHGEFVASPITSTGPVVVVSAVPVV